MLAGCGQKASVQFAQLCFLPILKARPRIGIIINLNTINKINVFLSYLNSPRRGCPRVMKICVQTILGLIRWKTTSNFQKWKTASIFFKNGRRPQFFSKLKTTSIVWEREDYVNFLKNGRRSQYSPPLYQTPSLTLLY